MKIWILFELDYYAEHFVSAHSSRLSAEAAFLAIPKRTAMVELERTEDFTAWGDRGCWDYCVREIEVAT